MPFQHEYATGESLLSLQRSPALEDFKAIIRSLPPGQQDPLPLITVPRNAWVPRRVIAFDGSTVTEPLRNGFPAADASLLKVSIVSIDLHKLEQGVTRDVIPSPRVFYDMEKSATFDVVLPGANIVRRDYLGDSPKRFFREKVFEAFGQRLDNNHETLLETMVALEQGRHDIGRTRSPVVCCEGEPLNPFLNGNMHQSCPCGKGTVFYTDTLRFSERFSDIASNGEAHGEVRHVLEILTLINMLRFFAQPQRLEYLRDNVFVFDGPLALFGHPAWLTPYIREELLRINTYCQQNGGFDIAVFGYEKSGAFVNHFEQLDFDESRGPRAKIPIGSIIAPDSRYINRNIALRPDDAKPHGADTYFGRKVLYKTRSGDHAVITTAMTNALSQDFRCNDRDCYSRLNDMLNVLDHLSTYLYRDGFMPLVRAHAHAAIPLRRGADIIRGLFADAGNNVSHVLGGRHGVER